MTDEVKPNVAHGVDDNTTVTLKGEDAALVLREDGQMEIFFPDRGEEAPVKGPALAIFKLALVFKNPQVGEMLDEMFDKAMTDIEAEEKANEATQASPVDPTNSTPST